MPKRSASSVAEPYGVAVGGRSRPVRLLADGRLILLLILVGGMAELSAPSWVLSCSACRAASSSSALGAWGCRQAWDQVRRLGRRHRGLGPRRCRHGPGDHLVLAIGHLLLSAVAIGMISSGRARGRLGGTGAHHMPGSSTASTSSAFSSRSPSSPPASPCWDWAGGSPQISISGSWPQTLPKRVRCHPRTSSVSRPCPRPARHGRQVTRRVADARESPRGP